MQKEWNKKWAAENLEVCAYNSPGTAAQLYVSDLKTEQVSHTQQPWIVPCLGILRNNLTQKS